MSIKRTIKLYEYAGGFPRAVAINADGGQCMVCSDGDTAKATITDSAGTAATNPVVGTRGEYTFYTANTVTLVDCYIMAPWGQFIVVEDVGEGITDVMVDVHNPNQTYVIPFDEADYTANTEFDTGMEILEHVVIKPDCMGVYVHTVDATETINVGLLSTESGGDADGFMAAVSLATAGFIPATVGFNVGSNSVGIDLTGGDQEFTYGVLMVGSGSKVAAAEYTDVDTEANGFYLLENHVGDGTAKTISYTTSAGSDTGHGLIILPAFLPLQHKRGLAV